MMEKPEYREVNKWEDDYEVGRGEGRNETIDEYEKFLPGAEEIRLILLGNDTPALRAIALAKRIGKE